MQQKKRSVPFGVVLAGSLLAVGSLWTVAASAATSSQSQVETYTPEQVVAGQQLFQKSCASCHGMQGQGQVGQAPSLIGVGALACDFQVSTGRMPLKVQAAQAPRGPAQFTDTEIKQLNAYCASLAPGPAVTTVDAAAGDIARGGELFRANCAQCHNFGGAGGALASGKYAPPLYPATHTQILGAIRTGPESMPVFGPQQLSEQDVNSVVKYIDYLKNSKDPGGNALGHLGPVPEGAIGWILGMGGLIAAGLWIGGRNRA